MANEAPGRDSPRWTLPPRKEISAENLHISSFVILKKTPSAGDDSLLLLKAGDKHPLSFRRGKLLLPAAILTYGEKPKEAVKRVVHEQLSEAGGLREPEFIDMQSYLGAHWDIVFVFRTSLNDSASTVAPKEPFVQATFYSMSSLPRAEMAPDHLEVIDSMLNSPLES